MCFNYFAVINLEKLKMITYEQIRRRLSAEIKNSGLTQSEIAKRIGVEQQQVSKIVNGNSKLSLDLFSNICKMLDLDADYILCLD